MPKKEPEKLGFHGAPGAPWDPNFSGSFFGIWPRFYFWLLASGSIFGRMYFWPDVFSASWYMTGLARAKAFKTRGARAEAHT